MDPNSIGYNGRLIGDVRVQLTQLLHDIALANLGHRRDLKRLCSIGMELLDNAERYGGSGAMLFEWRIEQGTLCVRVENRASKEDAERLVAIVERIRKMDNTEIQEAYSLQLTNDQFGEKGGAGLGFLQIARKVGQWIDARITPTDSGDFLCSSEVRTAL